MPDPGPQPVLTGPGVTLRPWRPDDADALQRAGQDPEIHYRTPLPAPFTRDDAVEFVTVTAPGAWAQGGAAFGIVDDADAVLGSIGTYPIRTGTAHVGYWLARESRGRGYGSGALQLITEWLIHDVGVARVELVIEPDNAGSERMAARCGFRLEGCLRSRHVLHGRRADVNVWSRLPGDPAPGGSIRGGR